MRLSRIKLAGFKSFVDPTTLTLPSNLVGVVGPNGCGKSNVIDAVRWVMGESSARQLRGDSMADVIFSGSASRKPVGQASIELTFDNADGTLGGAWAAYREIEIRRVLNRDGQSQYYLNGTRCRRRDITDIFLGTGLGPRSYAIIEQGMISRVIEAKPEELRVFLEEAAGISKYKERRRETAQRIAQTRENLARLADLRQELDKQLTHLKRQAEAAEQYKVLKAEERTLRGELFALRWQAHQQDAQRIELDITRAETAQEGERQRQTALDAQREDLREAQHDAQAAVDRAQALFYQAAAEVARLEQTQAAQADLKARQTRELDELDSQLARVSTDLEADREALAQVSDELATLAPSLAEARERLEESENALEAAEAGHHETQRNWERVSRDTATRQAEAERERHTITQIERQILNDDRRLERLRVDLDGLVDATDSDALALTRERFAEAEAVADEAEAQLAACEQSLADLTETERNRQRELNDRRARLEAARGQQASLQTLQDAALGGDGPIKAWLGRHGLDDAPVLASVLRVEPDWARAVEAVLGDRLRARVSATEPDDPTGAPERVYGVAPAATAAGSELAARAHGPLPAAWVHGVRCVGDLATALAERASLGPGESLVTPEGVWMGADWWQAGSAGEARDGIIERAQRLRELAVRIEDDETAVAGLDDAAEADRGRRGALEDQRQQRRADAQSAQRDLARLDGELRALEARYGEALARREAIEAEQSELRANRVQAVEELEACRLRLEVLLEGLEQLTADHARLEIAREASRQRLADTRAAADAGRRETQALEVRHTQLAGRAQALTQAVERLSADHAHRLERRERLLGDMHRVDAPEADLDTALQTALARQQDCERELALQRNILAGHIDAQREVEHALKAVAQAMQAAGSELERMRLAWGEARVRAQGVAEQAEESGTPVTEVLPTLQDTDLATREQRLEAVGRRLQRLGAINLAAIEEFDTLAERKAYLDAQDVDLNTALATLEEAIRKIDRETRGRFRETFEKVNEDMGRLFPRLFGGGEAHLALTGEDPLDAGVAIMARPPGKRIGNIHLLSGGEKALTAVALVFAIFQLNPAPFCMLDEVDAPLDEANVGRFGALLKEMSDKVQFIFITHNKATMEVARHLAGVTMHEPGVSRLVSVDVDQAVELATA